MRANEDVKADEDITLPNESDSNPLVFLTIATVTEFETFDIVADISDCNEQD